MSGPILENDKIIKHLFSSNFIISVLSVNNFLLLYAIWRLTLHKNQILAPREFCGAAAYSIGYFLVLIANSCSGNVFVEWICSKDIIEMELQLLLSTPMCAEYKEMRRDTEVNPLLIYNAPLTLCVLSITKTRDYRAH